MSGCAEMSGTVCRLMYSGDPDNRWWRPVAVGSSRPHQETKSRAPGHPPGADEEERAVKGQTHGKATLTNGGVIFQSEDRRAGRGPARLSSARGVVLREERRGGRRHESFVRIVCTRGEAAQRAS